MRIFGSYLSLGVFLILRFVHLSHRNKKLICKYEEWRLHCVNEEVFVDSY